MTAILIKLVSTGVKADGKTKTGTFKTTRRNPKNGKEKLTKKCYDRRAYNAETGKKGMHVIFKEEKIK